MPIVDCSTARGATNDGTWGPAQLILTLNKLTTASASSISANMASCRFKGLRKVLPIGFVNKSCFYF